MWINSYEEAAGLYLSRGYKFFDSGLYNLNVFAIRNTRQSKGHYNDVLYIAYKSEGGCILESGRCSTVAGEVFLVSPYNPLGAGSIVEGQYRCLWRPGYFRGRRALVQSGEVRARHVDGGVRVWGPEAGFYMHASYGGVAPTNIKNNSAGSVVILRSVFMERVMDLVKEQRRRLGVDCISFTLFNLSDVKGV